MCCAGGGAKAFIYTDHLHLGTGVTEVIVVLHLGKTPLFFECCFPMFVPSLSW
jgi:hypothetical protein